MKNLKNAFGKICIDNQEAKRVNSYFLNMIAGQYADKAKQMPKSARKVIEPSRPSLLAAKWVSNFLFESGLVKTLSTASVETGGFIKTSGHPDPIHIDLKLSTSSPIFKQLARSRRSKIQKPKEKKQTVIIEGPAGPAKVQVTKKGCDINDSKENRQMMKEKPSYGDTIVSDSFLDEMKPKPTKTREISVQKGGDRTKHHHHHQHHHHHHHHHHHNHHQHQQNNDYQRSDYYYSYQTPNYAPSYSYAYTQSQSRPTQQREIPFSVSSAQPKPLTNRERVSRLLNGPAILLIQPTREADVEPQEMPMGIPQYVPMPTMPQQQQQEMFNPPEIKSTSYSYYTEEEEETYHSGEGNKSSPTPQNKSSRTGNTASASRHSTQTGKDSKSAGIKSSTKKTDTKPSSDAEESSSVAPIDSTETETANKFKNKKASSKDNEEEEEEEEEEDDDEEEEEEEEEEAKEE